MAKKKKFYNIDTGPGLEMQTDHLAKSEDDSEVVKANLLDNVENGIWHAFDYLAHEEDGTAPKTKLKVRNF